MHGSQVTYSSQLRGRKTSSEHYRREWQHHGSCAYATQHGSRRGICVAQSRQHNTCAAPRAAGRPAPLEAGGCGVAAVLCQQLVDSLQLRMPRRLRSGGCVRTTRERSACWRAAAARGSVVFLGELRERAHVACHVGAVAARRHHGAVAHDHAAAQPPRARVSAAQQPAAQARRKAAHPTGTSQRSSARFACGARPRQHGRSRVPTRARAPQAARAA